MHAAAAAWPPPRFYLLPAGAPLDLIKPETMRWKVFEPVLLLGKQRFSNVDIRIRVKGGGNVSQIYAIRQAISKGIVAFYQKCEWAGRAGAGACVVDVLRLTRQTLRAAAAGTARAHQRIVGGQAGRRG